MRTKIFFCFLLIVSTNCLAFYDDQTKAVMEKAGEAFAKGDYTAAIRYYTEVLATDPDFDDALYSRASAYNNTGHFSKAIADYSKFLKFNPDSADAYYSRGKSYEGMGDYQNAIADYNQAITLGPSTQIDTVNAYNALAWILATCPQKKFRDGKRAVENAQAAWNISMKKSLNVMDTLAAAYAEAGDFTNAVKWEKQFIATPDLESALKDAKKRLVLYEAGKPYRDTE
jgi:tetratricopeptide (TPR) repeat protein